MGGWVSGVPPLGGGGGDTREGGCECTLCRPLAHGPAAALGVDGWGGWRSAAAVVLGVGVVDGWGSSRLPASSTKRKTPRRRWYQTDDEANGLLPQHQ